MNAPSTLACPSDEELVELVEGRLDEPALLRLREHVAGCGACARFLEGLGSEEARGLLPSTGRIESGVARAIVETEEGAPRASVLGRGALLGRYLVLSLIGRGGMGEVYAAYDPDLDRRVALKLLHTARGAERARARLLREARALGKLSHPNVVQVYDVGEHEGDVFVAMELVEGQALGAFCKGPPRPAWQDVLAAYRDAARGLAAAHAQGIVHRDVKPANILRGKDGRVRVADFGLAMGWSAAPVDAGDAGGAGADAPDALTLAEASPLSETVPAPSDSDGDAAALTATGALLGTPLYMAPEQFEGPEVGPASDQHSLCTALHEGLYGVLPFHVTQGPGRIVQLIARKNEGPPPSPPGSPVPASIYRAIARGLAPRPEDRFPSMDALVDALRDETPPRRRTLLGGAGIGVVAVLAAALAAARGGAFESPCAHPERQLAGAWDDGARGRVRAALLGTGRPYAEDTAGRVAQALDRYAASWAAMRGEVCEASRSGRQRKEIVSLRDACLDRRLGQIQALTGLLAEKPDVEVLDKAVQAAAGLPPVASCADVEALTARVRPPEDPATRARVAAMQPRVDRIEALFDAGKYKEGLPLGEALLVEARAVGYPPLRARAELRLGELEMETGDDEGAKALLRAAAVSAAVGRDEEVSAAAWAKLLFVAGERQQRLDEAAFLRAVGPAAVERTNDPEIRAEWASADGLALLHMGKYAEARAALERALAIREEALGSEDHAVATSLGNLGFALCSAGDCKAARPLFERSVAICDKALGPEHPETARALQNLGTTIMHLGEFAEAVAVLSRVLAIREKALGPDHPDVATTLDTLAGTFINMGNYPAAVDAAARALAIREKTLGPDHPFVGSALGTLGVALTRQGRFDAARPVLERALAVREKAQGASHPHVAEPLFYLGELAAARGKPEEAVPLFERALSLHDPELDSMIQGDLADALWEIGKERPRARALMEEARAAHAREGHRPAEDDAARWLAEHPL